MKTIEIKKQQLGETILQNSVQIITTIRQQKKKEKQQQQLNYLQLNKLQKINY